MRRTRSGCCARAATGQAAVVLARPAMKLRLLMGAAPLGRRQYPSTPWDNYGAVRYQQRADVRFGSEADISLSLADVLAPESRHCDQPRNVRLVPTGDIRAGVGY